MTCQLKWKIHLKKKPNVVCCAEFQLITKMYNFYHSLFPLWLACNFLKNPQVSNTIFWHNLVKNWYFICTDLCDRKYQEITQAIRVSRSAGFMPHTYKEAVFLDDPILAHGFREKLSGFIGDVKNVDENVSWWYPASWNVCERWYKNVVGGCIQVFKLLWWSVSHYFLFWGGCQSFLY